MCASIEAPSMVEGLPKFPVGSCVLYLSSTGAVETEIEDYDAETMKYSLSNGKKRVPENRINAKDPEESPPCKHHKLGDSEAADIWYYIHMSAPLRCLKVLGRNM